MQLRFNKNCTLEEVSNNLEIFNEGRLESIDLVLPYNENFTETAMKKMVSKYQRLSFIILYSAPESKVVSHDKLKTNIVYVSYEISSETHCGAIKPTNFYVNLYLFSESQSFNSCLNKKISIDKNGNIKNCPSMQESFGNINSVTLKEALETKGFTKFWNITKDQVEICADCEFRYICTDCRAFATNKEDHYSKPHKCTYDPYTATWQEAQDNPVKKFVNSSNIY